MKMTIIYAGKLRQYAMAPNKAYSEKYGGNEPYEVAQKSETYLRGLQ